jgi:hypothetical protein
LIVQHEQKTFDDIVSQQQHNMHQKSWRFWWQTLFGPSYAMLSCYSVQCCQWKQTNFPSV